MANERSGIQHAPHTHSASEESDRFAKGAIESKGVAAFSEATAEVGGVTADAGATGRRVSDHAGRKGRDAIHNVRGVGDTVAAAIDKSIAGRPYATLALAIGLGCLLGALWRR